MAQLNSVRTSQEGTSFKKKEELDRDNAYLEQHLDSTYCCLSSQA